MRNTMQQYTKKWQLLPRKGKSKTHEGCYNPTCHHLPHPLQEPCLLVP